MARFAVSTEHDQSATAWISSLLSLFYSTLSLAARYYLKSGAVAVDDGAIVIAQVLAFGQFGATFYGISHGLGKDLALLSPTNQVHSANAFEASQILYVLALAVSKIAVLILIDRIFSGLEYKHESILSKSLMAFIAVWGVGSALAVSVSCDARQILPDDGTICVGSSTRWLLITVFDILTEVALVALPVYLLTDLQMNKNHKITAGGAFAFRLIIIPFSVLHYTTYTRAVHAEKVGTAFSKVIGWQQATLCYSLLSATVPLSRTLFKRFETPALGLNETGTYSRSHRLDSAYGLKSNLSKTRSSNKDGTGVGGSVSGASAGDKHWWNGRSTNTYSTAVYHDEAARNGGHGSQDMIILREDVIEVQRS